MAYITSSESQQTLQSILQFYNDQENWAMNQMQLATYAPSSSSSVETQTSPSPPPARFTVALIKKHRKPTHSSKSSSLSPASKRRCLSHSTPRSHRLLLATKSSVSPPPHRPHAHLRTRPRILIRSCSQSPGPCQELPSDIAEQQIRSEARSHAMQHLLQSFQTMLNVHAETCRSLETLVQHSEQQPPYEPLIDDLWDL